MFTSWQFSPCSKLTLFSRGDSRLEIARNLRTNAAYVSVMTFRKKVRIFVLSQVGIQLLLLWFSRPICLPHCGGISVESFTGA